MVSTTSLPPHSAVSFEELRVLQTPTSSSSNNTNTNIDGHPAAIESQRSKLVGRMIVLKLRLGGQLHRTSIDTSQFRFADLTATACRCFGVFASATTFEYEGREVLHPTRTIAQTRCTISSDAELSEALELASRCCESRPGRNSLVVTIIPGHPASDVENNCVEQPASAENQCG
jgi:hypothetical protein